MRAHFVLTVCFGILLACTSAGAAIVKLPDPGVDDPLSATRGEQTAVLAGGCFWGVDAVFKHVKGVKNVWSGYAGGSESSAEYDMVRTGRTGHAESVEITYDPSQISYGQLLKIFFSVAHDPTELNRQGPDEGTQYRSVIFFRDEGQQRIAKAYIDQIDQSKVLKHKIVTQLVPLKGFYKAEEYHQNYAELHPTDSYIEFNDLPKIANLRRQFPEFYVGNQ